MRISVVIPMRNEESHIGDLLESLAEQSRAPDEIVIVDAGSTDESAAIVEQYHKRGLPINLIKTSAALPGRARNIGIGAATNEIVALTDAGMTLESDWLEAITAPFEQDAEVEVVFGACGCHSKTLFEKCVVVALTNRRKNSQNRYVIFPTIASLAIKKQVWQTHGPLRENLRAGEDRMFLDRLKECDKKAIVADYALSLWRPWQSIREVVFLSFRYGICDGLTLFKSFRHIRQILVVVLFVATVALSFRQIEWLWAVFGIAALSIIPAFCRNPRDFMATVGKQPLAIPILMFLVAVSYITGGAGFLVGTIQKSVTAPAAIAPIGQKKHVA